MHSGVLKTTALETAVEFPEIPVTLHQEQPGDPVVTSAPDVSPPAGRVIGELPGIGPENLGSPRMADLHGLRFPYICGEMANGIATVEMVESIARHGMLGFFGAAGLNLERIESAILQLQSRCRELAWGSNLIHSPADPELEDKTIDLYLRHG